MTDRSGNFNLLRESEMKLYGTQNPHLNHCEGIRIPWRAEVLGGQKRRINSVRPFWTRRARPSTDA